MKNSIKLMIVFTITLACSNVVARNVKVKIQHKESINTTITPIQETDECCQ